jgi:hypothetical protein
MYNAPSYKTACQQRKGLAGSVPRSQIPKTPDGIRKFLPRSQDPGGICAKFGFFALSPQRLIKLNQDVNRIRFFWPNKQLCNSSAAS